jgi:esterase/lipase superfamily enzyme
VTIGRSQQQEAVASRRAFLGGLASSGALALGGCAGIAAEGMMRPDVSALSVNPTMLVATTRRPANGGRANPWYGPERGSTLSIAKATFAPPGSGAFAFVSAGDWRLAAVEPMSGRVSDLLAHATSGPDLLVYIHGYRNTFEGSAVDAARLADGIKFRGETLVFSWPSRAGLLDYAYDRESAVWSRDAFERVLATAMANPNIGRIHIVAHSMGTLLALESLRQVYGRYGEAGADRIGAVIFASPDIDVDVFASSVARLGQVAQKLTVIVASNDRALALAGRVAGGVTRVGVADRQALAQLGVRVVDASALGFGLVNHDLFLSNDEMLRLIRRSVDNGGIAG